MRRNIILSVIFLLTIVGCRGPSIDANDDMGNTFYEQESPPSYGIVTGVNYITIQNDTGYNTVGTVREGANKQVISSQADSLIKISRIWADFFPANTSNQPI